MTKSLDDKVLVQYKSSIKEIEPYSLHYSNLDMIGFLTSVTVDSLEQKSASTRVSVPSQPWIGFVGTHKDILVEKNTAEKTKAEINSKLSQIIDKSMYKLFPAEDGFLFLVDNTTAGNKDKEDPVIKKLRKHISDSMDDLTKSHQSNN